AAAAPTQVSADAAPNTATPIKHLVVIFQENVSFDHYFATYPKATNPEGEPAFHAAADTPKTIDTLEQAGLLSNNPNKANSANGADASEPFRMDRSQAASADQNHGYTAEQAAYDGGKMDLFPAHTGKGSAGGAGSFGTKGQVMGYYDGNTVTALWNYAQTYAMNDNAYTSTFGPSTPGAINLVSGQTNGAILPPGYTLEKDGSYDKGRVVPDGNGGWTMISDLDPTDDVCSKGKTTLMGGRNIGNLLNDRHVSWGWFEGGFDLAAKNADGTTGCQRSTLSDVTKVRSADYIPHHEPFQYYPSTANPKHIRPSSAEVVGTDHDGGANHQYDTTDFFAALKAGNMPAVSFMKAPAYQDGHAGYSDPLDGQAFITEVTNAVQKSKFWKDTAIIVTYDDSDGWYDHAHAIVNPSDLKIKGYDVYSGDACGTGTPLPGVFGQPAEGRCGDETGSCGKSAIFARIVRSGLLSGSGMINTTGLPFTNLAHDKRRERANVKIGAPKEVFAGEARVAITPESAVQLQKLGYDCAIEAGAGLAAGFADAAYAAAGVEILPTAEALWDAADIVVKVRGPEETEAARLRKGQTLISFFWPAQNEALLEQCRAQGANVIAMDMVPRISRAQKMDALSSMANIAGYRAVVEAANNFGRFFTGQVTAAGKVPPARVLIVGAGVAGLAAIGASTSLGAMTYAFDVRPEVAEQIESMGAEFVYLDFEESQQDGAATGGYAAPSSPEFREKQLEKFRE
ncbi:hypothetical protein FGG78_27125, partial [Thioclava sp. BHET1]